jgi:DNA invertase Pin-like site-specific DNA recombinase
VLATFGQFERRLIGQRTKEALAAKKASGVRLGRPPTLPQTVVRRIQRQRARALATKNRRGLERRRRTHGSGWGAVVRGHGSSRSAKDVLTASGRVPGRTPSPLITHDAVGPLAGLRRPLRLTRSGSR